MSGHADIRFAEQPVYFCTRTVLALLVHLAVARRIHRRESLIALLWPESAPDRAATTLSRLRRAMQLAGGVPATAAGPVRRLRERENPERMVDYLDGTPPTGNSLDSSISSAACVTAFIKAGSGVCFSGPAPEASSCVT